MNASGFDIEAILSFLPESPSGRPLIVAIDGGSGSGKSTLGEAMASKLSAVFVGLDDFHIPVPDDILDARTPERNFLDAFDRGKIGELLAGHRRSSYQGVVIVEGVYSLRPEWDGLFDFRIWIEMAPALRMERMQVRKANSESQMRLWQATEAWYVEKFDPAKKANLVVDGLSGKILFHPAKPGSR